MDIWNSILATLECLKMALRFLNLVESLDVLCIIIITLCAYVQQGYVFGRVRLYINLYIYMYVNKKTGYLVPYRSKISC